MLDLDRQLLDGRLAAELLQHLALHPQDLVDRLDHVDGDADGAGLVGDGPGDGLADPPRGVGRELEALGVVELLDRPHEAEVALLDEVEEEQAPAHVALGDRHDEAQVGLDELALGRQPVGHQALQRRSSVSGGIGRLGPYSSSSSAMRAAAASPASMRWASATSCSPVSSGTLPISLRYMRTGSEPLPPAGVAVVERSAAARTRGAPGAGGASGGVGDRRRGDARRRLVDRGARPSPRASTLGDVVVERRRRSSSSSS